jgi:phosphohistidine phosphatase
VPVVRRLYLLRHAKSSWDDPGQDDHARPLSPRGERAARDMAAHLKREAVRPDLVLCSTAQRARQTLEALALASEARFEDDLYGAGAAALLGRLRGLPDAVSSVMLVGHNPGLQELALLLAGNGDPVLLNRVREKLPTGALVTLTFQVPWASLAQGGTTLAAMVRPEDL